MTVHTRTQGAWTQREGELVAHVLRQLDATPVDWITSGGSAARVLHAKTKTNQPITIKYLFRDDGKVDGHDLDSFRAKVEQIAAIRLTLPELGKYYVEITHQFHGSNWSAYVSPYYVGDPITASLTSGHESISRFEGDLRSVLGIVIELGYLPVSTATPNNHFFQNNILRIRRRLNLLHQHFPNELLASDIVLVNGRPCLMAPELMNRIEENRNLMATLNPPLLRFPVHGDANLGNFILLPDEDRQSGGRVQRPFRILDPRGTSSYWDPCYDFAKMLFSLTAFDQAMTSGFRVSSKIVYQTKSAYQVSFREKVPPGYAKAARGFLSLLESLNAYRQLTNSELADWSCRIKFLHAMHMIAESACRLSDLKSRRIGVKTGLSARQELALGLYLFGVLLLNDLLSIYPDIESRTMDEHLALLC